MEIVMHGPELNGSGKIVEQKVHPNNVAAFERSGWKVGALKEEAKTETEETPVEAPKKTRKKK